MDTSKLDHMEAGEPEAKCLSELELVTLELLIEKLGHNQQRLKTLQIGEQIRQLDVDALKRKSEICLLQAQVKETPEQKIVNAFTQLNVVITQAEKAKQAFIDEIAKKYNVADPNFGFNPETGEIVEAETAE